MWTVLKRERLPAKKWKSLIIASWLFHVEKPTTNPSIHMALHVLHDIWDICIYAYGKKKKKNKKGKERRRGGPIELTLKTDIISDNYSIVCLSFLFFFFSILYRLLLPRDDKRKSTVSLFIRDALTMSDGELE